MRNTSHQQALLRSEQRFHLLVDSVKEYAIFMLDPNGIVASWNLGAERIKGYRAEEIIGRHFSVFYPPEDVENGKPQRALQTAKIEGVYKDEGWRIRHDGSRFWASVVITPLLDPDGVVAGFAKVTRDMTARRNADEKLKRALDELARSNKDLESFSYSVSHDLRAPLRHIMSYLDLLRDNLRGKLDTESAEYCKKIESSAEEMNRLINSLLELGRLNGYPMEMQIVPLGHLAQEILGELISKDSARKTKITIDGDIPVRGDPTLLRTMLVNLLENAWKFTRLNSVSRIEIGMDRETGAIFVRDNGVGFDMKYVDSLFEPFHRLHSAHEFAGTGVGLTIVHKIVQRHGGRIWAESEEGKGTTFFFKLPLQKKQ